LFVTNGKHVERERYIARFGGEIELFGFRRSEYTSNNQVKLYHRQIFIVLLINFALVIVSVLDMIPNVETALAFEIPVVVTVDQVTDLDQSESVDFYPDINIAGHVFPYDPTESYHDPYDDEDDIHPTDWIFTQSVDSNAGSIPILITIWDEDNFFTGDDDHEDIFPGDGRSLNFNLDLVSCTITGDANGICGQGISSSGSEDDSALIQFHVNVVESGAPGIGVLCLHTPVWPRTTDTVTIKADFLDGKLQQNTKLADSIEIWTKDNINQPAKVGTGSSLSYIIGPFTNGGTFTYGCVVKDQGQTEFRGWKTVQVEVPPQGRAVPAVFTADRGDSIDIVLVPDRDDFTGPTDPNFLSDVEKIIKEYYSETIFYMNQDMINFWLAQDLGDAIEYNQLKCNIIPPSNWATDYSFADALAIVDHNGIPPGPNSGHCAQDGVFSNNPVQKIRTFVHETGHFPFGLADEYKGSVYYENPHFPNVYESQSLCEADKPVPSTVPCRPVDSTNPNNANWFTSDPGQHDLMVDDEIPQNLDVRRIDWMFSECAAIQSDYC
jgi:hypothetical protein